MSGLLNTLSELHQQRREGRRGHHDDDGGRNDHGFRHFGRGNDDDDPRRPSYPSQGPDQGRGYGSSGYAPPTGAPPASYGQRYDDDDDGRRPQSYDSQGRGQDQGRGYGSSGGGYAPPAGGPPSSYGRRSYQPDVDDHQRPQSYDSQGQGPDQGRGYGGYGPPSGPPPGARGSSGPASGFATQGGLDRGDFASDADIDRMVSSGEFNERQASGRKEYEYGSGYHDGGANLERQNAYGRHDAHTGPQRAQGHDERGSDYGRYDAPSGPSPGRGYQSQQSSEQSYGSGYGGGSDRPSQYGPSQTQGRGQYDTPQGPPSGYGRSQGNAPAGGFSTSRDEESRYGPGYNERTNDRSEPPRRGEAAGYYNQQGQDDRYAHLANLAQDHGGEDPELYRRATQGLHEKIQAQQSRPQRRDNEDDDYKAQVDAHRKAYGEDDHAPMSADAIGAAAAMEAIKQTAASNAPAGAFQTSKSGGPSSGAGKAAQQDEEEAGTAAPRAGGSGGLQDKLMALAMSQAGKLFDKKNAGSGGGGSSQDKAQAMQSAAATAMQLYGKYQSGKLDSSDMSSVMTLAMKML